MRDNLNSCPTVASEYFGSSMVAVHCPYDCPCHGYSCHSIDCLISHHNQQTSWPIGLGPVVLKSIVLMVVVEMLATALVFVMPIFETRVRQSAGTHAVQRFDAVACSCNNLKRRWI